MLTPQLDSAFAMKPPPSNPDFKAPVPVAMISRVSARVLARNRDDCDNGHTYTTARWWRATQFVIFERKILSRFSLACVTASSGGV